MTYNRDKKKKISKDASKKLSKTRAKRKTAKSF
jgi:hypothetical protein